MLLTLALLPLVAEVHLMQNGLEGWLVHAGLEPPRHAGEVLAEGLIKHLQHRGCAGGMVQAQHQLQRGGGPMIEQVADARLTLSELCSVALAMQCKWGIAAMPSTA